MVAKWGCFLLRGRLCKGSSAFGLCGLLQYCSEGWDRTLEPSFGLAQPLPVRCQTLPGRYTELHKLSSA